MMPIDRCQDRRCDPAVHPSNASKSGRFDVASTLHKRLAMKRRRSPSRTIPDHASRRIEDASLDSYGVIGEIARGGMSTIYLGEDRATGERVAIKALDAYYVG